MGLVAIRTLTRVGLGTGKKCPVLPVSAIAWVPFGSLVLVCVVAVGGSKSVVLTCSFILLVSTRTVLLHIEEDSRRRQLRLSLLLLMAFVASERGGPPLVCSALLADG